MGLTDRSRKGLRAAFFAFCYVSLAMAAVFTGKAALAVTQQAAQGVAYHPRRGRHLHANRIVHRDLNPPSRRAA